MAAELFGRTNRSFPKRWSSLLAPSQPVDFEILEEQTRALVAEGAPIDISRNPVLFGRLLPSDRETSLLQFSNYDVENSTDAKHAADLIQAHLIESLSCIGTGVIDFYFLRSRRPLEEEQLTGVMEALENARQEGYVRYFGLAAENAHAAMSNWQFNDAFEVVAISENVSHEDREMLMRAAKSRRCGILLRNEQSDDPLVCGLFDVALGKEAEVAGLRSF